MTAPRSTFIFAGGGTGGHLYPGLAIAESLRALAAQQTPDRAPPRCLFVCSDRPLDREILTREQAEFIPSFAKPIALRPRALARFLASWGPAIRQTREQIQLARRNGPVHLVAMGGFVAAPSVQAARAEHAPITLVNLDAVPGKANRWIARRIPRSSPSTPPNCFTAARVHGDSAELARDWAIVPPIVRASARCTLSRAESVAALGLDPSRRTLMVTGGSQGAKSINDFVVAFAAGPGRAHFADSDNTPERWQILHQTGKGERDRIHAAYQGAGVRAIVEDFVTGMARWWGAADLAIARAGAGNVAEAWANHVPTFFLPYPYHRDEHQKFNAAVLVESHGAWLAKDHIDPAANLADAGQTLTRLMDPETHSNARKALTNLGPANGAERIARALLSVP